MPLPPRFLEELRERLSISEVVGRRIPLRRTGREMGACCPFHKEKTPSFHVNDEKGFYHCFGCGAHGDIIGFVMQYENLPFPEAVERLAAEAGMEVPKPTPEEKKRYERELSLFDVLEATTAWFEKQLYEPHGKEGLAYFRRRGLSDEVIARHRLGYAPADAQALAKALMKAGASEEDLLDLGLLRKSEQAGRGTYAFFRNRVIFPVSDRRGRVVAFGARLMEGDGPKYINSPEHPLFHKSDILYGLHGARQAVAKGQDFVVVEGYMDVIAMVEAGFSGAVAPMGTAMTPPQVQLLWKLAPEERRSPILCFDGDGAGRRAAVRAIDVVMPILAAGQSVRVAFLPEGQDPDDLIHSAGAAAMEGVLSGARSLVDFTWETELSGRRLETPEARAGLLSSLSARARSIADPVVQGFYLDDFRRRVCALGGGERKRGQPGRYQTGRFQAGRFGTGGFVAPEVRISKRPGAGGAQKSREMLVVATMFNHPWLFSEFGEMFGAMDMPSGIFRDLRDAIVDEMMSGDELSAKELRLHLENRGMEKILNDLEASPVYKQNPSCRIDSPPHKARDGMSELLGHGRQRDFASEIRTAAEDLKREPDDGDVEERLMALGRRNLVGEE
ncbi:MAG TPA: DNA primase [Rhodospirillaceae bacterium]|nr:MAG: DNA primase [Alphaproteobacteria bacterium GWF2_58_20]HAU29669.1 DNA primase [Rhodospirillaceae bacterium]